ncbi:MAG: hypothetical protein K2F71_00405 [Paramuribaculum sp.]|nr:hypothetical protein [Paramuribaculum sp.]
MTFKRPYAEFLQRLLPPYSRLWRAVLSAIVALALVTGDYLLDNYPYPLLDDVDSLAFIELVSERVAHQTDDSIIYLNVAYDKQLVPLTDEFGDTMGSVVITDRNVLLHLLEAAENADYRFLALDVRFDQGMHTDADSALWAVMARLPRFAYSAHTEDSNAADSSTFHAASISDYGATLSTGFTRWQYLQDAGESMPLTMYRSINGGDIRRLGCFYTDRGRLCRNTLFIPLPSDILLPERPDGQIRYPLLSSQVMRWNNDEELAGMMRNRIVVVGDFDGDTHDTYIGSVPGPVLISCAYGQLQEGAHLVNWWYTLIIFAIYGLICYRVLSASPLWERFVWAKRYPALRTLLSFFGWEFLLTLLSIAMYLTIAESFITLLPATTFTALGWLNRNLSRNH